MAYSAFHTFKIDHFKVGSTLTDFPVYIDVTHSTLRTVANGGSVTNASGFDIGFSSDSAGTLLYKWDVEAYDPVAGRIRAHVKIPSVSSIVPNTIFYMPYADASIVTDLSDPVNVWTNSFLGVYHMKDGTTFSALDARNVNNGTNHGVTAIAGQINGGGGFAAASSQYIDLGTAINPAAITYSAWINPASYPSQYAGIFARSNVGYAQYSLFDLKATGKLVPSILASSAINYDGTGVFTLNLGTWYHVALTYDSTTGLRGYVNGLLDGSVAANGALNTTVLSTMIGTDINTAGRYFDGKMDEARIASVARTIDWLFAEYSTQNSSSTFAYFDAEPPLTRSVIGAVTGYSTVADWDDTTPQPGSANSGAALETPPITPFLWPSYSTFPGRLIDTGSGAGSKESWGVFGE